MKGNESRLELKVEGLEPGKRMFFFLSSFLTGGVYYITLLA